jgi:hypothetical protein
VVARRAAWEAEWPRLLLPLAVQGWRPDPVVIVEDVHCGFDGAAVTGCAKGVDDTTGGEAWA